MKEKYIFAIRDKKTGKLVNAKCGKNGKYYEMVAYANSRRNQLNWGCKEDRYEVVAFKLVEVAN